MDLKNTLILTMGYIGILLIVIGMIIIPSQGELRDAELRTERYFEWTYDEYNDEESDYRVALDEYDNLKWRELMSIQLGYLGLAFILFTITIAILRFRKPRGQIPPPRTYPEQYPLPLEPKDILVTGKRDFEVRD